MCHCRELLAGSIQECFSHHYHGNSLDCFLPVGSLTVQWTFPVIIPFAFFFFSFFSNRFSQHGVSISWLQRYLLRYSLKLYEVNGQFDLFFPLLLISDCITMSSQVETTFNFLEIRALNSHPDHQVNVQTILNSFCVLYALIRVKILNHFDFQNTTALFTKSNICVSSIGESWRSLSGDSVLPGVGRFWLIVGPQLLDERELEIQKNTPPT